MLLPFWLEQVLRDPTCLTDTRRPEFAGLTPAQTIQVLLQTVVTLGRLVFCTYRESLFRDDHSMSDVVRSVQNALSRVCM